MIYMRTVKMVYHGTYTVNCDWLICKSESFSIKNCVGCVWGSLVIKYSLFLFKFKLFRYVQDFISYESHFFEAAMKQNNSHQITPNMSFHLFHMPTNFRFFTCCCPFQTVVTTFLICLSYKECVKYTGIIFFLI